MIEVSTSTLLSSVRVPAPYLGPLFPPNVEPTVVTGFKYHVEELTLHGVTTHEAIDIDVPRHTPILAPADGYYVATYGERALLNDDGTPRRLTLKQVLRANPSNRDLNAPHQSRAARLFFGSFVVQGWHGHGRYTQYAHIDWANPKIPYYSPERVLDSQGRPMGDLKHSRILRAPVSRYRDPGIAAWLKAGELVGLVGMTGMGWGKHCYDFARFDRSGRPDFLAADYPYYTEPHLHFVCLRGRDPHTRRGITLDPFGIYGYRDDGYPKSQRLWHKQQIGAKHRPLWLRQC